MAHDFLIIGGGVIGLSIARELRLRGVGSVAVVDQGRVGGEASWAAGGMLAPNAETHEDGIFFRFCTASNALYPEFAAQLLEESGIDVELDRAGTLCLSFGENDDRSLSDKFEWQRSAGIDVERLSSDDIQRLEPAISPLVRSGLYYRNDWQVENRKLVGALRGSCERLGVEVLEGVKVEEILFESHRALGVRVPRDEIRAANIVIASGAWASKLTGAGAVRPIRGQMICFGGGPRVLRSVIYCGSGYVIPRTDGRVLAGATVEDVGFSKEVLPESIEALRAAALEISPGLASFDIKESWAGLRPFAPDGLPVIGPVTGREGVFAATGHYRNGILLAPLTAKIVADALTGDARSEYLNAFHPGRFSAGAAVSNQV